MTRTKKNPHAVALGRKGGKTNTKAQRDARRANGAKGGQPKRYMISGPGFFYRRRDAESEWELVPEPYDRAAREAYRRLKAGR